jgi:glycosyltransferase involved in cell wall biosynthesis
VPGISVVIPHLNDAAALARCLDALARQREAAPFEVIVVDNGSARPPAEVCAAAGARLMAEPTPGPGPARTRGAAAARGAVIAFIDADCRPDPDWIAAIDRAFADPSVEIAGGDVRIAPRDPARLTMVEAYESLYGYRMKLYVERDGYAATCNMAVRREVFAAVGGFAGIGVAEDWDWGRRATALGYRHSYLPQMRVATPARASFAELARKWDRHIAHFYEAALARPGGRLRWLGRAVLVTASPPGELPRVLASDRLGGAGDRARAFAGMARLRLYRARQMLRLAAGADPAGLAGGWRHGRGQTPPEG